MSWSKSSNNKDLAMNWHGFSQRFKAASAPPAWEESLAAEYQGAQWSARLHLTVVKPSPNIWVGVQCGLCHEDTSRAQEEYS